MYRIFPGFWETNAVAMGQRFYWIEGGSRRGKTYALGERYEQWWRGHSPGEEALVWAATGPTRQGLVGELQRRVGGDSPIRCQTPLAFMQEELLLFWPLLVEAGVSPRFIPVKLRPETEQALALACWREWFPQQAQSLSGGEQGRLVRHLLDSWQLAGAAGLSVEALDDRLAVGGLDLSPGELRPEEIGHFIRRWRAWCLERGFLTYGGIWDGYGQQLLPHPTYQHHLRQRYSALFADDGDDYPAIAVEVVKVLRPYLTVGAVTYNPDGQVRLGLNGDPGAWQTLREGAQVVRVNRPVGLTPTLGKDILTALAHPGSPLTLPFQIQALQTFSRSQLLRQTGEYVIQAIKTEGIPPSDIAIIAPGLDDIARYSLLTLFHQAQIPAIALNEQRPLPSSPLIRSLLTLLALVYRLGDWARREQVAEMLVVLSQIRSGGSTPAIDPVRAGLLADTCYAVSPDQPTLLPLETYPRWDRFGHQASEAYNALRHHLHQYQQWVTQENPPPLELLIALVNNHLPPQSLLTYEELAALKELGETLEHYWTVQSQLAPDGPLDSRKTLGDFCLLLSQGTVAARPRPDHPPWVSPPAAVTLATIYQYRTLKTQHRWHCWLDAGDRLWVKGGSAQLFASPILQRHRSPGPWTIEEQQRWDQARFERILKDLLARVTERLILCHSDINVRGSDQAGPLLPLIQQAQPLAIELPNPEDPGLLTQA